MRYARSFFRIKPRERSREGQGLSVVCTKGARLEVGVLPGREVADWDWWEVGYFRIRGSS